MKDLMTRISRMRDPEIPQEFMVLMKRNPKFNTSSVDVLSEEKNLDKKLSASNKLKVNDGVNLFVEDNRIPHPDSLEYDYL